ncbi:hypothetical protein EHV23_11800 [Lautropia dentalis]|jgi:hypothetical protein|uniref:PPM-type phosphatase domain-containing protein n=1 Tax=Lautropia dentalis TaxID=2490857 RepID=A0A426FN20_9BURK|nr:PP2C family serine/threonine-protein phosphatase [Lautropia dentalis]RRN44058.1 hypothetical protein EHV23_11800 [Lautropia dentalis]
MKHWSWASASCIGTSHSQSGQPLQDAHTCRMIYPAGVPGASASSLHPAPTQATGADDGNTAPWLLAIACDGAGSATHSRLGAVLTCRTLSQAVHRYFEQGSYLPPGHNLPSGHNLPPGGAASPGGMPGNGPSAAFGHGSQPYPPGLPDDATLHVWIERARQRIALAAARRGLQPRDFACTLLLALSNGRQTLVAHTGDGGIVAHHAQTQTWQTLSWPEHGEFAATTRFITDTPPEQTRIGRFDAPFDALAVFTDGIERLVLDMKTRTPHAPFFGAMTTPLLDEVPTAATHPTPAGNTGAGQAAPVPGTGAPAAPVQHTAQQGPSSVQHTAPQGPSVQHPGPQAPSAQHHNPQAPLAQRPGPQAPVQRPGGQPPTQRPGMQRAYAQGPNPQGAYMQRHNGQGSYAQGPYAQGPTTPRNPRAQNPRAQRPPAQGAGRPFGRPRFPRAQGRPPAATRPATPPPAWVATPLLERDMPDAPFLAPSAGAHMTPVAAQALPATGATQPAQAAQARPATAAMPPTQAAHAAGAMQPPGAAPAQGAPAAMPHQGAAPVSRSMAATAAAPATRATSVPAAAAATPAAPAPSYAPEAVWYGRHAALSAQLAAYLNSAAVNSRTDDDKTLIIAVLP